MTQWITDIKQKPALNQYIMVTLLEQGKAVVVACWYVEGDRIMLDQTPGSLTFGFSVVKAWQPFPEPYQN